jgi:hypothetical protein
MIFGVRKKTSLRSDETSMPLAQASAAGFGADADGRLDRAIVCEAGRQDIDVISAWEASLSDDDQAFLAALDADDRADTDA